ncbi:MAG TPA: dynamin family protein [Chthoniobacterales bacterium]
MNLGETWFEQRAALQRGLQDLLSFAHASKADEDTNHTVHGLSARVGEPFLFVVVGEVKAGKSSFLNALFGQEFCRVDVLPATDRIYLFKYGETERDLTLSPHLVELHRPIDFLRNFNIVDTPGTNSIILDHQSITERFVPLADLVLFVFSVTNPWAGSAWDFLALIQKKWLKKVAFVLQQSDLRSHEEVDRIVSHLRQTSLQKIGVECPVFAVSAKLALESARGIANPEKWEASHFPDLERHIDESVITNDGRREQLRSIQTTALVLLKQQVEKVRNSLGIIAQDFAKLTELKAILTQRKEQSLRQVGGFLRSVEQACDKCRMRGDEVLRERLTLMGTLKLMVHRGEWQQDFQKRIEADLQEAVQRELQKGLELLEGDLKSLWQSLYDMMQRSFAGDSRSRIAATQVFLDQRADIVRKLDLTLLEQMSDRQIETQLKHWFSETAAWLRVPGAVAAVGGLATVVAALTHVAILDVTGIVAASGAVVGTAVALFKRRQILQDYSKQMIARRDELTAALEGQLKHAIELFYQDLGATFAPLEDFCNAQKSQFEPLLEQSKQVEASLLRATIS